MILDEFAIHDKDLELVHVQDSEVNIIGITDNSEFRSRHILFIRDKKFLNKIESELSSHFDIGLVIDKSLYEKDFAKEFKGKFLFEYTSTNISMSICSISKVFYQEKVANYNEQVDGRQMGTVEIHPTALISQGVFIGEQVKIGENVRIYPGAVIGAHVEIGSDCEIFANVAIYHDVKIGKRCRIHSGTNIGADGFGYNFKDGVHHKIYHTGGVIIGDDVEIGSGANIDCGTFSATRIGNGCKLDNAVHVAHNVKLGQGVILCAGTTIAGSCVIGDYSAFGGLVGMSDNCEVGKACRVGGGAMITGSWPDNSTLGGHPARPVKEWLKGVAHIRKLTEKK